MNIFEFKNNALFLQAWRERTRLASVASAVILTAIVVTLIIVNASVNETKIHSYTCEGNFLNCESRSKTLPPIRKIILDVSIIQGVILLFFGSLAAHKYSSRERIKGTIDFHRSSPTARSHQVIGLLLGSTSLEWCLNLGLIVFQFFACLATSVSLLAFAKFNLALACASVLIHLLFIFSGITYQNKKPNVSAILLFFLLYIFIQLIYANQLTLIHHLTWLPAYEQLDIAVKGTEYVRQHRYYYHNKADLTYMLFSKKLPPLFLQLLIQAPLISVFFGGVMRKISKIDRPAVSKSVSLLTIFFILFLLSGSISSIALHKNYNWNDSKGLLNLFLYVTFILGVMGAIFATPNRLLFLKGLRKSKKLSRVRSNSADDSASNIIWQITFCFIVSAIYFIHLSLNPAAISIKTVCLLTLLSYCVFFASFLEYFLLSRYHRNKIVLGTILIVLWVMIPILGSILKPSPISYKFNIFYAFSPLYAINYIGEKLMNQASNQILYTFLIAASMAGIAIFLSKKERDKLRSAI